MLEERQDALGVHVRLVGFILYVHVLDRVVVLKASLEHLNQILHAVLDEVLGIGT